jgi:hypothetical protein
VTRRDEHRRPAEAAGAARQKGARDDRSEAVADGLWERVRSLAERMARYEEAEAVGELDEEGRARLDSLRVRAARAAERARLADELADELADRRGAAGRRETDFLRRPTQFP